MNFYCQNWDSQTGDEPSFLLWFADVPGSMIGDSSESLGAKGDLAGGDTSDKMPERYHHCVTLQHLEEGQNLIPTKIQNLEQN